MYDLVVYKYRCENGDPTITLVKKDESGMILLDYPLGCKNDNIYTLIRSLKQLTLPLDEKLRLFFKLLELTKYEATYTELSHLLKYYLL